MSSLSTDCHGRVRTTHMCPGCGGRFLTARGRIDAPRCRGTFPDFHPEPIETLPIIGCDEPPDRHYSIVFRGYGIRASTPTKARAAAMRTVQDILGGDTKKAAKIMETLSIFIDVVPDGEAPDGEGLLEPAELVWRRDTEPLAA